MTVVVIESDSEAITQKFLELAEQLGVSAKTSEPRRLTHQDLVFGIGRPATDEELREYLNRPDDGVRISSEELKAKYSE